MKLLTSSQNKLQFILKQIVFLFVLSLFSGCQSYSDQQDTVMKVDQESIHKTNPVQHQPVEDSLPSGCKIQSISPDQMWVTYYCPPLDENNGDDVPWTLWIKSNRNEGRSIQISNGENLRYFRWSPDSSMLAFNSLDKVFLLKAQDWASPQILFENPGKVSGFPIWSPNSKHFLITDLAEDPSLTLFSLDGSPETLLAGQDQISQSVKFPDTPTWAPDSQQIAYITVPDAEDYLRRRLWILDIESGDRYVALATEIPIIEPVWSPTDSNLIVVRDGNELYIFDLSKSTLDKIPYTFKEPVQYLWSPDGKQIAGRDNDGIWVFSLDDLSIKYIDDYPFHILGWTKDGKSISIQDATNSKISIETIQIP